MVWRPPCAHSGQRQSKLKNSPGRKEIKKKAQKGTNLIPGHHGDKNYRTQNTFFYRDKININRDKIFLIRPLRDKNYAFLDKKNDFLHPGPPGLLQECGAITIFAGEMAYPIIQDLPVTHRCPECGAPIKGRPDKKFCSIRCKNLYWNRSLRPFKEVRMKVVTTLSRNYTILGGLLEKGQTSIKLSDIEAMGFNMNAVTGCYARKAGSLDLGCYDIHYIQSGTKIFSIHKTKTSPVPEGAEDAASRGKAR